MRAMGLAKAAIVKPNNSLPSSMPVNRYKTVMAKIELMIAAIVFFMLAPSIHRAPD
jgi:hypothetical protein